MRDAIKTVFLVILLSIVGYIAFTMHDNIKKGVEILSRNKLSFDDPTVKILYPRIANNTLLRRADFDPQDLTSEEIIEYVFDNLKKEDYKTQKIKAVKIRCTVNSKIEFTTTKDSCNLLVINNSKFKDYQKKVFNNETELTFKDIDYKGYNCQNDGSKYYCIKNRYVESVVGYSLFADAYEDKDGVVIREYYLNINLADKDRCLNYFSQSYCNDYSNMDRQELSDDKIKQDGVLYEHRFVKEEESYYLKRSSVVTS